MRQTKEELIEDIQNSERYSDYFEEMRSNDVPEKELEEIAIQFAYCNQHGHDWEYWSDGVYGCACCPSTKMD